ncbi:MAG: hypothetical protein ACXVIY_05665, partial [Mucilaginibacter sp.]
GTQQDMEFMVFFKTPVKPRVLTLNCLRIIGTQIFFPTGIQVWGGPDPQHLHPIGSLTTTPQKKGDPDLVQGLNCKLSLNGPVSCLRVVAKPIYKLPSWHPAKGKPSWIFADEVLVN